MMKVIRSVLTFWYAYLLQFSVECHYVEFDDIVDISAELQDMKAERKAFTEKIFELESKLLIVETNALATETRLDDVKMKLAKSDENLNDVKDELDNALSRITVLEKSVEECKIHKDAPHEYLAGMGENISGANETRSFQKQTVAKQQRLAIDHPPATKQITRRGQQGVAFSATLNAGLSHLGHQNTIKFDRVILNAGNAFDASRGIFVCPFTGVYVFQSALLSTTQEQVDTEIVKNGHSLARLYASPNPTTNSFDQGYNAVITECSQGENVWVRIVESYGTQIYGAFFTSFNGYQLW